MHRRHLELAAEVAERPEPLFACTNELFTMPDELKALVAWDVAADGTVLGVDVVKSETWMGGFDECLVQTIQRRKLSPPPGKRRVQVTLPLELRTAGWTPPEDGAQQSPAPERAPREMFILGLRPSAASDKPPAQVATGLLAVELAEVDWLSTTTMDDIQAQLRVMQQRDALGCSNVECAASIGGALGVDMICYGYVSNLKSERSISATVVNRDGDVLARSVVLSDLDDSMETAVHTLARELLQKLR